MTTQPSQEIRLGVVMYGGVSLAIYINGVAQELLRVVRGTSALPDSELSSTELIYRDIGRLLHHGRREGSRSSSDRVRTRVVIDLLAGTSAGGINAVFLAKALAGRSRDLEELKQMWLVEADIHLLLNDGPSEVDQISGARRFQPGDRKTSLLNSRRMYGRLLDAFTRMSDRQQMDREQHPVAAGTRLADQLDLFVTATDLNGYYAPIELTDGLMQERVHKHVFRFSCDHGDPGGGREGKNQFSREYDPMLAFAARCTSSFPAAFAPMRYEDMRPEFPALDTRKELFRPFFDRYAAFGLPYEDRPFADGGYLDNKPFSYVTERFLVRDRLCPVQRKLLFVDPFPEYGGDCAPRPEINFVENTLAAASGLPRYETVRADIQTLTRRNRVQDRLRSLRQRVTVDERQAGRQPSGGLANYAEADLAAMVEIYGECYATYHHVKVYDATDELASLMARLAGLNEDSDLWTGVKYLARAWREANYTAYLPGEDTAAPQRSENAFLLDFDFSFRLRKLHYLLDTLDELLLPESMERVRSGYGIEGDALEAAIAGRRARITSAARFLMTRRGRLGSRLASPLRDTFRGLVKHITLEDLRRILAHRSDEAKKAEAARQYQRHKAVLDSLASAVGGEFRKLFVSPEANANPEPPAGNEPPAERYVAERLWNAFLNFERHDMLTLVFLSSSDAREDCDAEIYRISPSDTDLKPDSVDRHDKKLAGIQLGAFGAFLERGWRENDMLWGRLDGAERIIAALLPGPEDAGLRGEFIARARRCILEEELDPRRRDFLYRWLADQIRPNLPRNASAGQVISQIRKELETRALPPAVAQAAGCVDYETFLRRYYRLPAPPRPERAMQWSARAARIFSQMIDDLDEGRQGNAFTRSLRTAATLLLAMVRFALPHSAGALIWRHWLKLVALAALVLAVLGPVAGEGVAVTGWLALAACTVVGFAVGFLRLWFRGERFPKRFAIGAATALATVVTGLAAWKAAELLANLPLAPFR